MDLNKQCPAGQLSSVQRKKDSWALETPTGLRPHLTDRCLLLTGCVTWSMQLNLSELQVFI